MGAMAMSKGALLGAIAEEHGLKKGDEQSCGHCHKGSEKDGRLHYSRLVPHQDPNKASNQGGGEDHVWQGSQSQGKASQDGCEGLPSGGIESSDLKYKGSVLHAFSEVVPWESYGTGSRQILVGCVFTTVQAPSHG